jgi:hypothetical protein
MLQASYFDGRSTRIRVVDLSVVGADLVIFGDDVHLQVPFSEVSVDERLGRAPRRLRFKDGTFCEVRDLDALDRLLVLAGHRDGWVDRMQRHLQVVMVSLVVCAALAVAAYKWGLPWAAAEAAKRLPPALGQTLSAQSLNSPSEQDCEGTSAAAERTVSRPASAGRRQPSLDALIS